MQSHRGKDLSVLQFVSLHIVYLLGVKEFTVNSRNYYENHTSQNYCQLCNRGLKIKILSTFMLVICI